MLVDGAAHTRKVDVIYLDIFKLVDGSSNAYHVVGFSNNLTGDLKFHVINKVKVKWRQSK